MGAFYSNFLLFKFDEKCKICRLGKMFCDTVLTVIGWANLRTSKGRKIEHRDIDIFNWGRLTKCTFWHSTGSRDLFLSETQNQRANNFQYFVKKHFFSLWRLRENYFRTMKYLFKVFSSSQLKFYLKRSEEQ